MLNENDLQELHLIAELSKKESAQQTIGRMPAGEAREKAQAKFDKFFGGDGEKAKATKTKADFKKGEFEIVGDPLQPKKRDARGNLTDVDTAPKELDIGSAKSSGGISNFLKKRREKTAALAKGRTVGEPATGQSTQVDRKGPGAYDAAGTPEARRAKKLIGAQGGNVPKAVAKAKSDRQAKGMLGPAAAAAADPKKAGSSDDDLAKQGIRGGPIERRRKLAKDLADMRADRKPRPETDAELKRDHDARQSPNASAAATKPKFVAQKGGQTPSQKAASRTGADISTNSAGPSRPASRTGADISAPKIRPAPKPDRQAKGMMGPSAGSAPRPAPTTKDADELDAAPAPKIASPRPAPKPAPTTKGADELNAAPAPKIAAPKPPKKPKQSAVDKAVADNARFQTDESKDFTVQSMREALEDVWRNGATVQENLRSSKESNGTRVLRTGKTMTGGRPAVIETNPKDPTSRNMGMTNEEFAIRDLTESMTDEEYQLFEISASSALSLAKTFGKIPKGITAAQIRAMAKEYGIDLSELEGSISDMMRGNFDNVTYKGKPIPSKVKSGVINSFMKAGGVEKIGKGSVKAAAKEAGKFTKGEDESKLDPAVKKRRNEVLGTGKKDSNASKPKEVDTKKPDSEKDSKKVTRGRDKDGTPYVQKDITKDMEKLYKKEPKSDGAPGEKDDEFLSDPKFKGKSKSKPVEIEITKYKKSGVDTSDDDKASRKGDAVPKKPREGGEELDAAPAPSAPKDKKKEPKEKKPDPTEDGKYAYYEKDPKKRTKNSAMYRTQKGYDADADVQGESFDAVDATSNFLSNISKDDTMYSWSLSTKK